MSWPAAALDRMATAASTDPSPERCIDSASATTSQAALDVLVCEILPPQGCWSDEQYLWLTDHGRRMVEFTDGRIEELPLPTYTPSGSAVVPARPRSAPGSSLGAVLRCLRD